MLNLKEIMSGNLDLIRTVRKTKKEYKKCLRAHLKKDVGKGQLIFVVARLSIVIVEYMKTSYFRYRKRLAR